MLPISRTLSKPNLFEELNNEERSPRRINHTPRSGTRGCLIFGSLGAVLRNQEFSAGTQGHARKNAVREPLWAIRLCYFLEREKNGEFPFQGGPVQQNSPYNALTNNNGGATGTCCFTQSETTLTAFGNTVVVGFNDAGSVAGGSNKFTGFARSTDGGATFTDGGTLPTNPNGDAGDPVMARNETTGRIYFATLQFDNSGMNVFRSDDNGMTWSLPVQGMPGKTGFQDKEWIAVDNFAGAGNGNVYLAARDFGAGNGVYFYRSTDHGLTFGPNGGTLLVSGGQGAFVAVGPDHSVYAFWYGADEIKMRKSTDQGLTFAPAVTVISGMVGGVNGDLGLTGIRNGTASASGFRSNSFPHVVVNPVSMAPVRDIW